jgi:fructose-specific phosphotransferase system IIC component
MLPTEEEYEENVEREEYPAPEETATHDRSETRLNNIGENRSGFTNGLSVGLGIGCIATFTVIWISLFFTPQIPPTIQYETLLSIFIYPLLYVLVVGLIALTAGIVKEYYTKKY